MQQALKIKINKNKKLKQNKSFKLSDSFSFSNDKIFI